MQTLNGAGNKAKLAAIDDDVDDDDDELVEKEDHTVLKAWFDAKELRGLFLINYWKKK